jgi:hypothetical protein
MKILEFEKHLNESYKWFEYNKKIFPVFAQCVPNKTEFEIKQTVFRRIPMKAMEIASKLPIIGSPS